PQGECGLKTFFKPTVGHDAKFGTQPRDVGNKPFRFLASGVSCANGEQIRAPRKISKKLDYAPDRHALARRNVDGSHKIAIYKSDKSRRHVGNIKIVTFLLAGRCFHHLSASQSASDIRYKSA